MWLRNVAIAAALTASGCGDHAGNGVPDASTPTDAADTEGVRLAIEISNDIPESVYVQLNEEDGQPAWVIVTRGTERVYLVERCEIEDCGPNPPGVCGAALPLVRDITGGGITGSIELQWNLTTSVLDPQSGCETRDIAPSGDYTARFCIALQADIQGQGDPTDAVQGRVIDPFCTDVPFDVPGDDEVVYQLQGG